MKRHFAASEKAGGIFYAYVFGKKGTFPKRHLTSLVKMAVFTKFYFMALQKYVIYALFYFTLRKLRSII